MTREIAKKALTFAIDEELINNDKIVDRIYDDFESRTCESMEHIKIRAFDAGYVLSTAYISGIWYAEYCTIEYYKNNGTANKWEISNISEDEAINKVIEILRKNNVKI